MEIQSAFGSGLEFVFATDEIAKWVNHYDGIAPKPNCAFAELYTDAGDTTLGLQLLWIGESPPEDGAQLLVDYGYQLTPDITFPEDDPELNSKEDEDQIEINAEDKIESPVDDLGDDINADNYEAEDIADRNDDMDEEEEGRTGTAELNQKKRKSRQARQRNRSGHH